METDEQRYLREVNKYFSKLRTCKKHNGKCIYMGSIEDRVKKYNEIKNNDLLYRKNVLPRGEERTN